MEQVDTQTYVKIDQIQKSDYSEYGLKSYSLTCDELTIRSLRRALLTPFLPQHAWKYHLKPQWVGENKDTMRVRVFNGGYDPVSEKFFWERRYCIGVAIMHRNYQNHYLAELHEPKSDNRPYRFATRLTPANGEQRFCIVHQRANLH